MKQIFFLLSVSLILVSSCPDREFSCSSADCLPSASADCKSGSDEEFGGMQRYKDTFNLGSCDFESNFCGWTNATDSFFVENWTLEMANITAIPGRDHTTNTSEGHFMYANGSVGGPFHDVILEYAIDKVPAVGCQLRFWYYIHPKKTSVSYSTLELKRTGSKEEQLLRITKKQTDNWETDFAIIGNQAGYKLQFSFDPSYGGTDAMLDDIRFEYCGDGDVPEGADQLSCDFEQDTCSWYHDYSASLLWRQDKNNLNGKGYYMHITTWGSVDHSAAARLISFPNSTAQVICVTFSYYIFGTSIGSLKFIAKHSTGEETVMWMRSGTQGNKWRFADLTFSDKPTQFIIEAVVGGDEGSIAIDNIVVTSPESGSCPAERECTFQGSLCGLKPQASAAFAWSRITATSQPDNSSGPAADHTLGTEQGFYLSAQLWSHPVGSRGAMMTADMEPTTGAGECLMFWYYMEGSGVGDLNVYLQTTGSPSALLWTRSGDQGKRWRHGRVTLTSPSSTYQVIFEAVVGPGLRRDIAIDDLTIQNGVCPPPGFCDFEMDLCGWVNSRPAESGVDWDWLSGENSGLMIPKLDHTLRHITGHFVSFIASWYGRFEIGRLESETMEKIDTACLEMWYNWQGFLNDYPTDTILTVFVNETTGLRPVLNTTGRYMSSTSWKRERVDYNASGPHQIILQATFPSASATESLSLDDVHIIRGKTCAEIFPTTTPVPPTTTTAAPPSDCSFEQGLCSWLVQEVNDDLDWTISHGLSGERPWDGPQYDHSLENNKGFFLLLNGSGSGQRAVISFAPLTSPTLKMCVNFWYYMLGPSVSSLDLLVKTSSSEELVWTRRGTQSPEWINAQVTINTRDIERVMFTGHRNTSSEGFIAIDDVIVKKEACKAPDVYPHSEVCGFESGLCGFEHDASHSAHWVPKKATKSEVDHTYRTEKGFYMSVTPYLSGSVVAQLLTPEINSGSELCARFWYQLPEGSLDTLSVHAWRNGEESDPLWERSVVPSLGWEVAEVTVSSPANFRVEFRATLAESSDAEVKLDDVSVREGACRPPGSCDFESGQCNWVNVLEEDGHDWVLGQGGFQGPQTDHTTQTSEGWFLLSSSLHQDQKSRASVLSEWIQQKDGVSCLTFWYQMDSSSDSGTLRVFVRSGLSEDVLMFSSNSSGPSWSQFSKSIEGNKTFQLLIQAASNNRGFIAIDDITVTPGLCLVNETGSGFVGCTFENGTCDWEDMSVGQLQWTRGRNASENMGPSVDHTLGTQLGWYMAVDYNRGVEMSPAAFKSPTMRQASSTCMLHFHYNMFGEDNVKLNVVLMGGSSATTLWWLSGDHSDLWHRGEVTVGRVPQNFTVLFEASRTLIEPGHIAIDDIGFTNCSLPGRFPCSSVIRKDPQPSCPADTFTCSNKVCVESNRVCDFIDDCGDGSDESNCEKHGVVERCSFEEGLCSWMRSDVDTPGAEWVRDKGQDAWPDRGPPRDHTHNSAAGHYVMPGSHLTDKGQTSEILSRTLLPSSNCTVRFFFFSLDDAAATLAARLRTHRPGSDDRSLWLKGNAQSHSWQRAEVTFSSSVNSKIVFRYELGDRPSGLVALDGISFSRECVFDPANNELPDTSPTSTPPTNPCQDNEFFCWRSVGKVCIARDLQCNYHPDCPKQEDEEGCGPCTFESDQCQWTDTSDGQSRWLRQRASNGTEPPTDHTTGTGYYMRVNLGQGATQNEAQLQSPLLSPSSPYCQILFHFHISAASAGSLRVLMQQAEGSEAILWSRSHNTVSHWTPEHLPIGLQQQHYKVWFSSLNKDKTTTDHVVAVDDISFLNCEKSYQPPALSACGCSFEDGQCLWMQGAEDELDWLIGSGPSETPNTGPAGDHTTGKGKYLYIKSSLPSVSGNVAQLKSPLLPPAAESGYCFTFWYHMFGATMGSLRMALRTPKLLNETLVWQKSGNQGDEWQLAQIHVTSQTVHQVILEATVGGEAGDIAIDDVSLVSGPCPVYDVCDFEENSCEWQQQTDDDFDWVRHSGSTLNPNTGPDSDHTTNTPAGHYYYLPSSSADRAGQTAKMSSPLYPAGKGACVQLWYHMYGRGMGSLNVYQQSEEGRQAQIFSQMGDQGQLWRFAQGSLLHWGQPYRIVVEGVKSGPTQEGDMAFDDVHLTDAECPAPGHCDFETNMCSWSNLGGGVDQGDWLRGRGASPNPITGPSVDHTTNSSKGYYLFVDSTVGKWGDMSFLTSDVFQPSTRGHCLTFWYHMYGLDVGTLSVYINDRKMHEGGYNKGIQKWTDSQNRGHEWQQANVWLEHNEPFWILFVYQRGMNAGGDIALDDISILHGSCYTDPDIGPPSSTIDTLSIGLAVGLTLLAGVIIVIILFVLNRRRKQMNSPMILEEIIDQNPGINLFDATDDKTQRSKSEFSFFNNLYAPSPPGSGAKEDSADA